MAHIEQLHAQAFLGLLRAGAPETALTVYDDVVPTSPPTTYVKAYLHTTTPGITALKGTSDRTVTRAYLHCVGLTASAARAVAGQVRARLLDQVPIIPGHTCFPVRDDNAGGPPQRDETIGPLVMDQVVVYRLESVPAS